MPLVCKMTKYSIGPPVSKSKMTKALLLKQAIMYDHDSGWEQGEVMVVTGRGAVEKSCVIIFESLPGEKVTMQLSRDTYCSDNDFSKGKWFMLVDKN